MTTDNTLLDPAAKRRKFVRLMKEADQAYTDAYTEIERNLDVALKPHRDAFEKATASFKAEYDKATAVLIQDASDAHSRIDKALKAAQQEASKAAYGA